MKYLKTFESNTPDVDDFVYIDIDPKTKIKFNFDSDVVKIDKKIGKIVSVDYGDTSKRYNVLIDDEIFEVYLDEIVLFGNSKEEVELKINTNKYNL